MKKLLSMILSVCIILFTVTCLPAISSSAAIELTNDEIASKNYPVPDGYSLDQIYATYDTANQKADVTNSLYEVHRSTQTGTYYDTSSIKITTRNAWREMGALDSSFSYSSDGFSFWYKSEQPLMYRFRCNNSILFYGDLPASTGQWVTYFNDGRMINGTINSSSSSKNITSYISDTSNKFCLNFMFTTSSERSVFVDEFISIKKDINTIDSTILAAKNYPIPSGYEINQLLNTYDSSSDRNLVSNSLYSIEHSTEEATYYNTASIKITTKNAYREMSTLNTAIPLKGDGFMFWYKSENTVSYRLRMNNSIMIYGTLPASTGQWVTYYYYGKAVNINISSSSAQKVLSPYANNDDNKFSLNLMFETATERSVYFDEFLTFKAKPTQADVYNSTNEFFKYSLKQLESETNTNANYNDDGSAIFSSKYGATASNNPIKIAYNLVSSQAARAILRAKENTGYLKFSCDNISCTNSSGTDAYAKISLVINGIQKELVKYSYGAGTTDEYLIDVSDVNPQNGTTLSLAITGSSLCNVSFKLSPISVFYYPEGETILQAEDLNPQLKKSGTVSSANTYTDTDGNRTYIYSEAGTSTVDLLFTLPELQVGEYDVYASCSANSNYSTKYNVSVNNLIQLYDIPFADSNYSNYNHNINIPIGKITISKSFSDGASVLRLTNVPKCNSYIYIDFFSFKKTDKLVEPQSSSNFTIKSYPEMDIYEVKTILNTFDDYLCGTDDRYYKGIQTAGYSGDGTAFNLNSRGTVGKSYFDNNSIWQSSIGLDGDGLRFWYKSSSTATLQFKNASNAVVYSKNLTATNGNWITIMYTDLISNGDLSNITSLALKTSSSSAYYVDELHTIQQKVGNVLYELNGDGTASVSGYYLRLEDVVINSEYQGCPVTTIKQGALQGATTLKSINLPNSVSIIEADAFKNDLNLSTVQLGNAITTIGANAFNNCPKLGNLNMPSSLTNVDSTSFTGCNLLIMNVDPSSYIKTFALNNHISYRSTYSDYIYLNNFQNVILENYLGQQTSIDLPNSIDGFNVTKIGQNLFKQNSTLTSIKMPESLISIGDTAFNDCVSLSSVTLNNGLQTIGAQAFGNCTLISNITLPESITSIGNNAFYNCEDLIAVVVKDSYAYNYVNENSIIQIPNTTSLFKYSLCNYSATIISYIGAGGDIEIPSTIDGYKCIAVGANAFANSNAITSVIFPSENLKKIYQGAFHNCINLTTFTPGSVNYIYSNAFTNCAITQLNLTNLVKYASDAFDSTVKIDVTVLQFARSAYTLCQDFTAGFNLGNTFESYNTSKGYGTLTTLQSEQLWGAPETTQAMINYIADSGFNLIRIPITWYAFINTNDGYKIDQAYFNRIKQVVDWCMEKNMYVIINIHHDPWLNLSLDMTKVTEEFTAVWTQIAEQFSMYDERLIFESMNEVRAGDDWYGQTEQILSDFNSLNQTFYNIVRNSGGYNDVRYLMLETYGAQFGAHQINPFWCPSTSTDNHIIASIHMYNETTSPSTFTPNFQRMYNAFSANGIPCVIGETGIPCWDHYDDEYRVNWINCYMDLAESYGFKSIFWDDHGNYTLLNRSSLSWKYPLEIAQIMSVAEKYKVV